MNTMIPNKVRFDLNLQDLPARATEVDRESVMKVSGGGCSKTYVCKERGADGTGIGTVTVWWGNCGSTHGDWACNQWLKWCRGSCYAIERGDF